MDEKIDYLINDLREQWRRARQHDQSLGFLEFLIIMQLRLMLEED